MVHMCLQYYSVIICLEPMDNTYLTLSITFLLYSEVNCFVILLNNTDIAVEFKRHNNEVGCPAEGIEHNPIFIASLLHFVNVTLF